MPAFSVYKPVYSSLINQGVNIQNRRLTLFSNPILYRTLSMSNYLKKS